jgi:hypothetical protein
MTVDRSRMLPSDPEFQSLSQMARATAAKINYPERSTSLRLFVVDEGYVADFSVTEAQVAGGGLTLLFDHTGQMVCGFARP